MLYGSIVNEEYAIPLDDDDDDDLLLNKSKNNDYKASTTMTYSTSSVERYCFQDSADNIDYNDNVTTFKTGGNTTTTNWFFQLLGFSSNPLISTTSITGLKQQQLHYSGKNSAAADMRLAMLSNFSTAYNIMSISLALPMLQTTTARNDSDNNIKSLCSSALIAGMILGQLCGGTLGDVCGRHVAMALCMGLQIVGSLGSACCSMGQRLVLILSIWRFILGLGCGGVYPLAATLSSPSCPKSVALVFSMQGVGYLVVPAVAWGLIQLLPNQIAWRVLLGGGCLPGILLTLLRLQQHKPVNENLEYRYKTTPTTTNTRTASISLWEAIWMEENLWMKLLGTAGCWFLFDIMFYANTLFQPMVLSSAFGASETVQSTARDAFCIALMALPGYFISIATVGRQSPRYIQLQGFFSHGVFVCHNECLFPSIGEQSHAPFDSLWFHFFLFQLWSQLYYVHVAKYDI